MNNRLAPSILSGNFANLGEQIKELEAAGVTDLHFDVMDGFFVPNISFGIPVLKSLRPATGLYMDVHLMIEKPIRYIQAFADAGADLISFHIEACENARDCREVICAIRTAGKEVGLVVNPETEAEAIFPFVEEVDMILVMGVHPGFGGQGMEAGTAEKIRKIRAFLEEKDLEKDIEVDGGVKLDNVTEMLEAGANVIVAGSAVFKGNVGENAEAFLKKIL